MGAGVFWDEGAPIPLVPVRNKFGLIPQVYFDWTEGSPLVHFLRFILRGLGRGRAGHGGPPTMERPRAIAS